MKDKLRDILCFVYGAKPIRPKEIIIKKAEELILSLIKENCPKKIKITPEARLDWGDKAAEKIKEICDNYIDDCMKALTEGGVS